MTKKDILYEDAQRLYLYEMLSIEGIAKKLNVNRKTIMAWRDEGDWETRRNEFIKSKTTFHEEMFVLARKLMQDIAMDIDSGEKPDQCKIYALCKFIPLFAKAKDYEDELAKKSKKEEQKGLTPELIARIEEEVLGITHNDSTTNEEI